MDGDALVVVALGRPVVAVGTNAEDNLLFGNLRGYSVERLANPLLRRHWTGSAHRGMLVVGHEHQIIVIFGQFLHVVVFVGGLYILRDVQTVAMEGLREILDKGGQCLVVAGLQFLKVEVHSDEVMALTALKHLGNESLPLLLIEEQLRYSQGPELAVVGIGDNGHHGHTSLFHQLIALGVDVLFEALVILIDEEPLWHHEVQTAYTFLQ